MGLIKDISSPASNDDSAELNYFFDILDHFLSILKSETSTQNPQLTLIARSPESNIAKAIFNYREKFQEHNAEFKIIFAHLNNPECLYEWLLPETSLCGKTPAQNIRWARRTNLVDAHEQLTLSNKCSWSGESMRREVSSRFGYYIFDKDCPKAAIRGERSFNALWKISENIPLAYIKRAKQANDSNYLSAHSDTSGFSLSDAHFVASEFTRH